VPDALSRILDQEDDSDNVEEERIVASLLPVTL